MWDLEKAALPPILRSPQFWLSHIPPSHHPTSLFPCPSLCIPSLLRCLPLHQHQLAACQQVYARFLHSKLSRDPSEHISTYNAQVYLRFLEGGGGGGAEQTPSSPLAFFDYAEKRLDYDSPGMVLGYILSTTAALLALEVCGWHGFSGLWFRLQRFSAEQLGRPYHLPLVFDLAPCSVAAAGDNPCASEPVARDRI